MHLVDTHCHVHFHAYRDDRDEVIRRALDSGVAMITVGTQKDTSRTGVEVAEKFDGLYASVGLHPNHLTAMEFDEDEMPVKTRSERFDPDYYETLGKNNKVVAIGECGLDYYRLPKDADIEAVKSLQKDTFRAHMDLATKLNLPLIVHCRDAHDDQYAMLESAIRDGKLARRGVIHSFTGTHDEAERYTSLGFFIGFNGIVAFPPRKGDPEPLATVARRIPLDRMVLETDAPYLTPPPHRGKRNEPAHVRHVAEFIATLRDISLDQVAQVTSENANRIFSLNRAPVHK